MHKGIAENLCPPASILPPSSYALHTCKMQSFLKVCAPTGGHLWEPFAAWGLLSALRFITRGQFTLLWASVSCLCNEELAYWTVRSLAS